MKRSRLPLRTQYAAMTCSIVTLAVVMLVSGFPFFYEVYDRIARSRLPPTVEAQLEALEATDNLDDTGLAEWQGIYDEYRLDPPVSLEITVLVAIGLFVLALTGVVGFWLADRFGRPVAAVAQAAQRVARGDFSARAEVPPPASRELSALVADFNSMADQLDRAENERRTTTAAIAHELRTPLTVMRGRLIGMLDGVFETNRQEVARLLAQTDLLTHIVEGLRTVTLAEAGRLDLRRSAIDLCALAEECIDMMRPQLTDRGLWVRLQGRPVVALIDRERMMQAISALLDNAGCHASGSGVLDVIVDHDTETANIAVADRGPGLPPGTAELVFHEFWRADESRSRTSGGSGLGLAVVRAIVSAHGAQARARNRDGGGTIFEIVIPLT